VARALGRGQGWRLEANERGLSELTEQQGMSALVDDRAKDIAVLAARLAPVVGKLQWVVRENFEPGSTGMRNQAVIAYYTKEATRGIKSEFGVKRRRAAVIAFHPMKTGQARGRTAIRTATAAAVGKVSKPKAKKVADA